MNRRQLLIGTAAGGALVLAWSLTPRQQSLPLSAGDGEYAFDGWIKLGTDGMLSVAVPQLEMGQGISTILPQIAAYELGADWNRVAIEPAPLHQLYANSILAARWASLGLPATARISDGTAHSWAQHNSFATTADGTSLAAYEAPLRAAAASARAMLCMAAADKWNVDWRECMAQAGLISHGKQQARFGDLVTFAIQKSPPSTPVLREKPVAETSAHFIPGLKLDYPRLDLPAKASGALVYAGDVRLPDLAYAAIRHAPWGETAELTKYDAKAAAATAGFIRLITGPDWLAAVAENSWAAEQALRAASPHFKVENAVNSPALATAQIHALQGDDADVVAKQGDPATYLAGNFTLTSQYQLAPALHGAIETAAVTARYKNGRLELWLASQAPFAAQRDAASALGLSTSDIVVYPLPAGGSFDARLEHDHAIIAAKLAKEVARPVQLIHTRWQEMVAAKPRQPVTARLAARCAADGTLVALKSRIAMPAAAREFGARLLAGEDARKAFTTNSDPLDTEGAVPPYSIEHLLVEHVPTPGFLPSGRLRGNGHAISAFITECFIDELAAKAKREPLSYRIGSLGGAPRLVACLQRAAALALWNGGADASGQGLACHQMQLGPASGHIAAIAVAARDAKGVSVSKIVAVADIGRVVNIDIARQQLEGGLVFGLGLALGSATGYRHGLPIAQHLADLSLPSLANSPEIMVELIDSTAPAFDPGELGAIIAPPAIANALASATGNRFRSLPLLAEDA